ncbi:MAG: hypothetical protein WC875_02250 [Candidatus Absconditabacterales bacterium]
MPAKKPVKKTDNKVTVANVEKKAKLFAKSVEKEAKVVKAEGKEIGTKIGARREVSSTEEKIYTILGILILIRGLYILRGMIGGMLLIVLGILFVTGFFLKRKQ